MPYSPLSFCRISLRELFLLTALAACLFGYWRQSQTAEEAAAARVELEAEVEKLKREHVAVGLKAMGLPFSYNPFPNVDYHGGKLELNADQKINRDVLQEVLRHRYRLVELELNGRWEGNHRWLIRATANLELYELSLNDDQAVDEVLALWVQAFPTLRSLRLKKTQVERPIQLIQEALPELRYLELGPSASVEDFLRIGELNSLVYLDVEGVPLTPECFAPLGRLKALRFLHLKQIPHVDAAMCREIAQLPHLNALTLDGETVDPEALPVLANDPGLNSLTLTAVGLTPQQLAAFAKSPTLKNLFLDYGDFTDAEKTHIKTILPGIQVLFGGLQRPTSTQ